MAKNWTEEDEDHIRQNFLTQTYGELAEHFGVTTKAMESKIRRMGLKKQELLAEAADPLEVEPVVQYEEPPEPEEPGPSPIESIRKLERRIEVFEETEEERATRLEQTREAAEVEKARREESREQEPIADALKKFEDGVTKLLDGKRAQAAKLFQAIIDEPPNDLGLVMRARQYLAATEEEEGDAEPKLKTAEDMYQHGVVLMNDGDFVGSLEIFEQAAKKEPKDDRICYVRAVALALSEQEEEALEMLAAAIELNEVNRIYARNDPDFALLAPNSEFRTLTAPPPSEDDEEDEA
ncbi:MAG: tetratricopeptide repeat protein [Acidobacteriota bacterium]|jgi:tetratricopeptide (TPR) repeat protein